MGLWLKVPDMNHAVLIPGEKGQCGQRADQAGDPNQGRSRQSPTAQECHLSRLQRGKGRHFLVCLIPSSPDEHPCLVRERKSSPGRPRRGQLSPRAPVHLHHALDPRAGRNQARDSLKAPGPSSSPCMVGLPQTPSPLQAPSTWAQPALCPEMFPPNLSTARPRFETPGTLRSAPATF